MIVYSEDIKCKELKLYLQNNLWKVEKYLWIGQLTMRELCHLNLLISHYNLTKTYIFSIKHKEKEFFIKKKFDKIV